MVTTIIGNTQTRNCLVSFCFHIFREELTMCRIILVLLRKRKDDRWSLMEGTLRNICQYLQNKSEILLKCAELLSIVRNNDNFFKAIYNCLWTSLFSTKSIKSVFRQGQVIHNFSGRFPPWSFFIWEQVCQGIHFW